MSTTTPVFRNRNASGQLSELNGTPLTPCAGCVTSSGSATSHSTTATPFTLSPGQLLAIQPDTACYVATGATSAAAITAVTGSSATAGGFKIDPGFAVTYYLALPGTDAFVAILPVSGTTNLKVFQQV
jgi:hypothetical protein